MFLTIAVLGVDAGRLVIEKFSVIRTGKGNEDIIRDPVLRDEHLIIREVKQRLIFPFQTDSFRLGLGSDGLTVDKEAVLPAVGLCPPGILVKGAGAVLAIDVIDPVAADIVIRSRRAAEMGIQSVEPF